MKASPAYMAWYGRYGRLLTEAQAEAFANDHGFYLADLEGLAREGEYVTTLSLFEALGY